MIKHLTKKAAMFGLDARIALAIFAALSAVTGSVVYNTVIESRETALLSEMDALGKAVSAYMRDTGKNIRLNDTGGSSNIVARYQDLLVDHNVAGWAGPYFSEPIDGTVRYRYNHKTYQFAYIYYLTMADWGEGVFSNAYGCGLDSFTGVCGIWALISLVDRDVVKSLDQRVDGGDGGRAGRLRYTYPTDSSALQWHLIYHIGYKI